MKEKHIKALQEAIELLPEGHEMSEHHYQYYLTLFPKAPSLEEIKKEENWDKAVQEAYRNL